MQAELVRATESHKISTSWERRPAKQVVIVYPLHCNHEVQMMTLGCLAAAAALAVAGTSVSYRHPVVDLQKLGSTAPAALLARDENAQPTVASMLQTIRKRTALTWEQLASIFEVTRRAVHHWASGNAVTAGNHHKVGVLFQRVAAFGQVDPFVVRSSILDLYGTGGRLPDRLARSEPILNADHSPLVAENSVRRTPATRVRRG